MNSDNLQKPTASVYFSGVIMRQIIYTTIFIFICCFANFAQTSKSINAASETPPLLFAEFNDSDNEWYKIAMEILGQELANHPSSKGFIKIRNDKVFLQRLRLVKMGLRFYKMDLSRISLLIIDEQKHDTEVLVLDYSAEAPKFEDCIVIRATDIDKIEKLFKPKSITKKRKKQ